jgi:hypothetical protein
MGLPWFTGPVLFILVQDNGIDFGVAACIGILLGVVCISVFILVYGRVARLARWPASLASAVALYAVSAWAAHGPELLPALTPHNTSPLAVAAAAGALSLALTGLLLPRPRTASLPQALPWWDILFGCWRPGPWWPGCCWRPKRARTPARASSPPIRDPSQSSARSRTTVGAAVR